MKSTLRLLLHKLFKTTKLATAYHEAGHCVVAALFADKLNLKTLSANKAYMKKIDPSYKGGLLLEWINIPSQTDYQSGDHLILISLAGICAKTIYCKGHSYTRKNLSLFKNNPKELMEIEGAFDDYEIAKTFSRPISQYLNVRKEIIEWSAFRWNFEFLMTSEVWNATIKIAEEIIKHPNQTLNDSEIIATIRKVKLDVYLDSNKDIFLSKRYPLTNKTLIP